MMLSKIMPVSRVVMIVAVAALVLGIVFVVQGTTKADWIRDAMRVEKVTLGIDAEAAAQGEVVDSASEAQQAADVIREHRRSIAPTYNELLAGGRYDPSNPDHLKYTQALNMENYLYMAVFALSFTDMVIVVGVFMILVGIALGAIWMALRRKPALATTSAQETATE